MGDPTAAHSGLLLWIAAMWLLVQFGSDVLVGWSTGVMVLDLRDTFTALLISHQ